MIVSIFAQKHRSGFNLDFETLLESIWQAVADLRQRNWTISSCFKTSNSVVLQKSQNWRERKQMAQATCGQTLATHISGFLVDFDELLKYYTARVTACYLCTAICTYAKIPLLSKFKGKSSNVVYI